MGILCVGCLASDRTLWTLHKEAYKLGLDLFPSIRQKTTSQIMQAEKIRERIEKKKEYWNRKPARELKKKIEELKKFLAFQRKPKQEIKLCWECHNMIANIHKFKQRVNKAQELLKNKKIDITKIKCLSTLSAVTHIDNFDYIFCESPIDTVKQEAEMDLSDRDEYSAYEHETVLKEQFLDDFKELFDNDEQKLDDSVEISESFGNRDNADHKFKNVKNDGNELKKENKTDNYTNYFKQEFQEQVPSGAGSENMFDITFHAKSGEVSKTKKTKGENNTKGTSKGQQKGRKVGPAKKGAQGSYEIVTIAEIPISIESQASFLGSKYKKIIIDQKEVKELKNSCIRERKRRFGCKCGSYFGSDSALEKHVRKFHLEQSGKYTCDICDKRMKTSKKMANHLREHFLKFQCLICQKICFPRTKMFAHLRTHMKVLRCIVCKLTFCHRQDFNNHYKELHARHVCDYCGFTTTKKNFLQRHITKKHVQHKCKECNKEFLRQDTLRVHILTYHTCSAPEESYCVECDMQFKNITQLKNHFSDSSRHNRKTSKVSCPECDNVYTRLKYMRNHYNYVHLKRTKYYCDQCAMYFLNCTHLTRHLLSKHGIGEVKKDKLCPHCGRGFSTRAILTKHIRTHTGERPYACKFCPAAFTQSTPCNTHMKKQHNWEKLTEKT